MVTEEEMYNYQQQQQSELLDSQLQREQANQVQINKEQERSEASLSSSQLEIEDELERFQYLLRGKIPRNQDGEIVWDNPPNSDEVLLTDEGVNLVMRTVRFYVNKNTLLSNYDEQTINAKMEDLGISLADALFMSYGKYFLYPTAEECQEKLITRLKNKQQQQVYNSELKGEEIDKEKIWKELVNEINPSLEREKIREGGIKDKLKGYDLLLRVVQDFIHSAYQRSWNGQERLTLRQHWHITENRTPMMQPQAQSTGGLFSFFKGR